LKDHKFDVQDEGQIEDFLGVRIWHNRNHTIEMSQPRVIQQILQDLNLEPPIGATTNTLKYTHLLNLLTHLQWVRLSWNVIPKVNVT
jgi:hypothetical protein